MENAVKALSMAGSVLLSLLIIVLVIFYYDSLRINEEMKRAKREEKEVDSINTQFETYLVKKYLIGSEVLSLANLAKNYNSPEYLNNGYNEIVLNVKLNDSSGMIADSKLFGGHFTSADALYDAYQEDNSKVQSALDKQYSDPSTRTEYKYGGHSFEFWFQWIDAGAGYGYALDTNSNSYRKFYKKYKEITEGEIISDEDINNHPTMLNDTVPKELWDYALEYAEKKNVIIDFSRLNFEVKAVEYDPVSDRIQKIVIEEIN